MAARSWASDCKSRDVSRLPIFGLLSGGNGRDRHLAEELMRSGHTVAVSKHDVAQLAMLVNEYGDAILSNEVSDAEERTLDEALGHAKESYGHVDVIAVILEPWADGFEQDMTLPPRLSPAGNGFTRTVGLLTAGLPDADVVVVTGQVDGRPQDRLTSRMLNSALESRLRQAAVALHSGREVSVCEINDFTEQLRAPSTRYLR